MGFFEDRIPAFSIGRAFFGLAVAASGVLQLATGQFVRIVPALPPSVPIPGAAAYGVGLLLVAIGLGIVFGWAGRTAAAVFALLVLFDVLFIYPPQFFTHPEIDHPFLRGFMYTNPLKCLALIGGAAMLAARLPGSSAPLPKLVTAVAPRAWLGPFLMAAFLVVCGMQHFAYAPFVDTLVPKWIPPSPRLWTYFTGMALMAGGLGIFVPRTRTLAAGLSAVMVFLWVLLLHIPRALAEASHANETAGVFEALAISGVALLIASGRTESGGAGGVPRHVHS
jgi:uncharacterized membrane protein